jgi:membrane protease YdiL (CAAX protease family)
MLSALITGLAVAFFEEVLFRGALLKGLLTQSNVVSAVIATALVYAAVHFIQYTEPDLDHINLMTAPGQFISAYSSVLSSENYDAFLSFFILGVLLGLLRVNTGNILHCISLHAGLVVGIKFFKFFAQYQSDSPYQFLVNEYDYRLGYAALGLLIMATIIYLFRIYVNKSQGK